MYGLASLTPTTPQATLPVAQAQNQPDPNRTESNNPLIGGLPIALTIFGVIVVLWFLNNFMQICNPNEILILSGRKHRTKGGQEMGYRVIFGGRVIAIPILEKVTRMDLTTMPVPVEVKNAYSRGGTPLNIQAIANVKISSDTKVVGNAIERFLDHNRNEVKRVARETLEGNLRGVVATLTPEQINEDRLEFAERIAQDVSRDLIKLGLHLDTLKIQSASDDVDYLSSIGRRRISQIVRDAEIAESNAIGEAERIEAQCQQQAEVAKTEALSVIQEKQNELRKIKAELEQRARSEEERTEAAAKEARARAEQQLQTVRAELERLRLEADEVLPADAQRQAQELRAKGNAAALAENAKASAQVNDMLAKVWKETGADAAEVFLIQQIDMVLKQAAQIPNRVHIERVNVIDNGDGRSISGLVNAYPDIVRQFLERVDQTLGLNVIGILNRQSHPSRIPERLLPPDSADTTELPPSPNWPPNPPGDDLWNS
ncbi:flotillin family protein [Synechococcales cyanobacterium C]|uniref:Flotillin family protein n=1 Tax=Petrachloros mirabilis ULC683 TaxID=2781853 RepID=A0A8K1ZY74_9CYAN|nr:SPFH domain-containing protein [Petrachloros mirabilis]NCJ07053.1 flotillin family protein [Petrachloros mirabilis ULC683]